MHDVTEEPETEYIGYEFGKRSGSKENPEKQKWIRREFIPEDKMVELVKKYETAFSVEEIEDHWTTWVLQGNSWKNMEGPVSIAPSPRLVALPAVPLRLQVGCCPSLDFCRLDLYG